MSRQSGGPCSVASAAMRPIGFGEAVQNTFTLYNNHVLAPHTRTDISTFLVKFPSSRLPFSFRSKYTRLFVIFNFRLYLRYISHFTSFHQTSLVLITSSTNIMRSTLLSAAALALAAAQLCASQTFTSCDPTKKSEFI
jgi:hypothetical protein